MYQNPTINELIDALKNNYEEAVKNFSNVIEINSFFKREVILGDIDRRRN